MAEAIVPGEHPGDPGLITRRPHLHGKTIARIAATPVGNEWAFLFTDGTWCILGSSINYDMTEIELSEQPRDSFLHELDVIDRAEWERRIEANYVESKRSQQEELDRLDRENYERLKAKFEG